MSDIGERLKAIEGNQERMKEELEELCTQLNGQDGTGGMFGEVFKRLRRLEFYLAIAIGAGTVIAWVFDRALGIALITK